MSGGGVPGTPDPAGGPSIAAAGSLEELDGSPIRAPEAAPVAPAIPWPAAARRAAGLAAARPDLWVYALLAFLARGGVVVLALPIVVLPTFIGLANVIGPASVSASGPSPRLLGLIVLVVGSGAALAVAGTLLAAATETALHRATAPSAVADGSGAIADGTGAGTGEAGRRPTLAPFALPAPATSAARAAARVAAVRLALVVPVVAAVAVALPPWAAVAYHELTLPSDIATPLPVRVLAGAPLPSLAVAVTWLAAEAVGGFAARRAALLDSGAGRALGEGLLDVLRDPAGTALALVAGIVPSLIVLAPAIAALGAAWDGARAALVGSADPLGALGATLLLAVAWLAALLVAAIAAAWRATLVTGELLRRHPSSGRASRSARHAAP